MDDPSTNTQTLPAGTRIGDFMIERVLGAGGFGITYLAKDTRLGRQVVIKENLPAQYCFRDPNSLTVAPRHTHGDDAGNFRWSLDNFTREAAMLASLDHPGIVKVLRSFEAFGTAYFVMPFVEGRTLDEIAIERKSAGREFTEEELRSLLEPMLDALDYLHDRGIYHRDIKPGNILITGNGKPVLIDFGSARQRLSERSMTVVESAGYTPFEQLQTRGNVGPWSDLYALAATVVKIMTGEAPPKANDRTMGDPWQPLAGREELKGRCSQKFLQGLDRALKLPIEERWQNAEEWKAALSGCDMLESGKSASGTPALSDVVAKRKSKWLSFPWPLAAVAAALVWAAIGGWWALRGGSNSTPEVMHSLTGGLVITSEPSGAVVVSKAGEKLGHTPVELKGLPGGSSWEGSLDLEGYTRAKVLAEVSAGDMRLVPPVKLEPLPQKVTVTSEPSGAEVMEGESIIGSTPLELNKTPQTLIAYRLRMDGYEDLDLVDMLEVAKPLKLHGILVPVVNRDADKPLVYEKRSVAPSSLILYPWKTRVTCTVFWIGQKADSVNPTPHNKSSWDQQWASNFGGYDDPDPANRIANHAQGEFRPKGFVPKLNPFYVALPYNDVTGEHSHRPEASRVIPWFSRMRPEPGDTVCKGRWLQIYRNGRSCYAQWEDCGPWVTDDWEYVFGNKPPRNPQNGQAGLDISPAVRDFLGLKSGQKVHWRFVDAGNVPYGPWKKYGQSNDPVAANPDLALQQRRLEQLRRLRDEEFARQPASQIEGKAETAAPEGDSEAIRKANETGDAKTLEGWDLVKIGDAEYVDMESIKRFYNFPKLSQTNDVLVLENPKVEARFQIGSDYCILNGCKFHLFEKIASQDDMVFLSRADLARVLDPILRPNFVQGAGDFRTVILDPLSGVRKNDGYETHANGSEAALKVALLVKLLLNANGYRVLLTRESEDGVSRDSRLETVNSVKEPAVVIMIGFAASEPEERGIRTFACDPTMPEATKSQIDAYAPSLCLAASVHGSTLRRLQMYTMDGGISRIRDSFMSRVKHPVILIEGGFVTHAHEARLIGSKFYQGALADSIVDAVVKYRFAVGSNVARPVLVPTR